MTDNTLEAKKNAATLALPFVESAQTIGIGTGSTVECLIDALQTTSWSHKKIYVSSSKRTTQALFKAGFPTIYAPQDVTEVDVYIDGADWIDMQGVAIKGYGGALFQEKLLAAMAQKRIAIVSCNKIVPAVCGFNQPLPIEVIDTARSYVARRLSQQGARVVYREGMRTDQNNPILDIYDWPWENPLQTEHYLKSIIGIVESGLFALQHFHTVLQG